ncbi:MAG: efflux RND transporter periplasmic adaptor subunit [Aeoliella sp.]
MSLRNTLAHLGRPALFLMPVLVGAAVLFTVIANRESTQQAEIPETSRPLLVIDVPQTVVVPRALGFGTARPGDVWSAVAEVKGRIVEAHPELKAGAMIRKDETVARIDRSEYELKVAQLQAEIAQLEAQQTELDAEEVNFKSALTIEQESHRLAERELKRLSGLRESNTVSESEVEDMSRTVLAQQQKVQSLRSSLNVLPAQRKALAANLLAKQAALGQAQLDLDRTILTAPFDCRLSDVSLEEGQFVSAGELLFEAFGTAVTEIEAQMPIDQVRKLLARGGTPIDLDSDAMQTMRSVFDVEAIVRLRLGEFEVQWTGRFDRVREELDAETRTLRVVIAVDRPYDNVVPGERPPLAPGMFCEVELRGPERADQVVVPRTSVREGAVYVVNNKSRLERRAVEITFSQGGFSVISSGVSPGDQLVVSDPTPAVEGMLVEPTLDGPIQKNLISEAAGEGELR